MTNRYAEAGVNIETGNAFVDQIKGLVKKTHRPEMLSGIGGFGGLFKLPSGYTSPVLVAGTDGVGTKLKLAIDLNQHDTIGIDLVAMCVNDLLCQGAEPLFFLDYYATSDLDIEVGKSIVHGIVEGCTQCGMSLLGGETAEMPGMYQPGDYDLAGFALGIVEESKIITGNNISPGDIILGLPSSGIHSNGYSLVRKILQDAQINLDEPFEQSTLGDILLKPTKIYVNPVLAIADQLHGVSHITGGGITENLPRILPANRRAEINLDAWELPPIFKWVASHADMDQDDMLRTFNCGIGLILIIPADSAKACEKSLREHGESPVKIGVVREGQQDVQYTGALF